jgi:hypothetical protein
MTIGKLRAIVTDADQKRRLTTVQATDDLVFAGISW